MGTVLQSLHFGRDIRYPSHIGRIGLDIQIQAWLKAMQFRSKSLHTLGASIHHTGTSLYRIARSKDLRITLKHTMSDTLMLKGTKLAQSATVTSGIFPYTLQHSLHLQPQWSEITLIFKMLADPDIPVILRHPTGTMATIMADIKGCISLRNIQRIRQHIGSLTKSSSLGRRTFRISIIDTTHLLAGLSLQRKHASQRDI